MLLRFAVQFGRIIGLVRGVDALYDVDQLLYYDLPRNKVIYGCGSTEFGAVGLSNRAHEKKASQICVNKVTKKYITQSTLVHYAFLRMLNNTRHSL